MPVSFPKIRLKQIDLDELNDFADNKIKNKVDKDGDKQLSTNDFTDELKLKLETVNVEATKVTGSDINGNIVIDGEETVVYTHPGTGTNPHGTTAEDLGLDKVENKSSQDIRDEITQEDVERAIGHEVDAISDKYYVHEQTTASNNWIVDHNLNKFCNVMVYDDQKNEIFADINYIDENQLIISFSKAITGKAYLS